MQYSKFQLHKVKRLLNTWGEIFSFSRLGENEFKEPSSQMLSVEIKGVYHESSSFLTKTVADSTTARSKPSPMILCLWEDALKLKVTDTLNYNSRKYTISGIKNIGEANAVADISLEEVLSNGNF